MIRQLYPEWFRGLDADDPAVSELLEEGYIVPLPQRDDFGRQVIFTCAGKHPHNKYLRCLCTLEDHNHSLILPQSLKYLQLNILHSCGFNHKQSKVSHTGLKLVT